MIKDLVPSVHFYDQDFVDLYDRSWVWINNAWKHDGDVDSGFGYLSYEGQETYNQFYSVLSAMFLIYSNSTYNPFDMVDYFYKKQESNGAIRCDYDIKTGKPVLSDANPEGLCPPLFSWMEYSFYHKSGNKKRLKDVIPVLERYYTWLSDNFRKDNGLFCVPAAACMTGNIPREKCVYPIDFNCEVAVNALYMSAIGDILNDKDLSFRYKRLYFSLKTRIDSMMWDPDDRFYYDLDADGNRIKDVQHIGAYWALLAEIPNEDRAETMISYLKDENKFGTYNPFPCVPKDSKYFSDDGNGMCGGVVPFFTFMVIKGLEKYGEFSFAHDCAMQHVYMILGVLAGDGEKPGDVWEAYMPTKDGLPVSAEMPGFPRKRFMPMIGLITITLMLEDIIGLDISLPRKTVNWTMKTLESMGIENFSLKRNFITIQCNKNVRGWEIRLESEKLYYFTIKVLDQNKTHTLPIPSGKCSILVDKL